MAAALLGLALLPASRLAAQQSAPKPQDPIKPAAATTQPAGEARELVVEISPEEFEMTLFRADPALLQQKYAAKFRLKADRRYVSGNERFIPQELHSRLRIQRTFMLPYPTSVSMSHDSYSQYFEELAAQLPAHLMLTEEQSSFFNTKADAGYLSIQHVGDLSFRAEPFPLEHEVIVIAPDQTTAKSRAGAVLQMLDYGLFLPLQSALAEQIEEARKERAARQETDQAAKRHLAELREQLNRAEDISGEALNDLRNQRRLLTVDLAGIEAKIKTCGEILSRLDRDNAGRIEQVENIKITAEIELAGLAARRKSLDSIIAIAEGVIALQQKTNDAEIERTTALNNLSAAQRSLERLSDLHKYSAPPAVVDNKIVVQPIRWTNQ